MFEKFNNMNEPTTIIIIVLMNQASLPLPLALAQHSNSARTIFYPRLEAPAGKGQVRCGAHSDTGAITLLWPDGPGLEVCY